MLNIGHQGAAGLEPGNTVRSFRRAEAEGADAVELDLHVTSDGHLVVLHDPTVDRTTDGAGRVDQMTLDQLRTLDAGMGERVPTFTEVLEATRLPIHAEIKAVEAAPLLAEEMVQLNVGARVTPVAFDPRALTRVRSVLPDVAVGLIFREASLPATAGRVAELRASTASMKAELMESVTAEQVHEAGCDVWVWTVNDGPQMRRLIDAGVSGIVTDRPDVLAEVRSTDARPEGPQRQ